MKHNSLGELEIICDNSNEDERKWLLDHVDDWFKNKNIGSNPCELILLFLN